VKGEQHYHSLDGLRGIAALSVVLLHYVTAFLPFLIGYAAIDRYPKLDHVVATSPLQLPIAGNFAVCIFFVLSGFVLSIKFFKTKDRQVVVSSAARRIFRLMIPAVGSIFLAYFVLRIGAMHNGPAGAATGNNWLQLFWSYPAHFGQALFQGLYGIWFGNTDFIASYNVPLWTMHYELLGSFLVFGLLALFGTERNRWLFYGLFGLILIKTYFLAFIAGLAICDLSLTQPVLLQKLRPRFFWLALPLCAVLGTWTTTVDTPYPSVYNHLHVPFFTNGELETFAHVVGAILVMLAVLRLPGLAKFLAKRPFQYLGKISFALYLTHFIVLGSLSSYLFTWLLPVAGYAATLLIVFLVGLSVSFGLAHYYTRWVDTPSVGLSKQAGDYLLRGAIMSDIKQFIRRVTGRLQPALVAEISEPAPSAD